MNAEKGYKLVDHARCHNELARFALAVPFFDVVNGKVVCMDGFRLAIADIGAPANFPPYETLIPKEYKVTVKVNVNELLMVARSFATAKFTPPIVRINIKKDSLHFYTQNEGNPNMTAELKYEIESGDTANVKVAINPKYLFECVKSLKVASGKGLSITMSIGTPAQPIKFTTADYTEVVMPMFVRWENFKKDGN